MQEFSLEKFAEQIHYGKTKTYFKEVLSSYNNGNYRSSVVMLWSVAICDIVYKLQYLIDLYEDAEAARILSKVTSIQSKDQKSSAWEIYLVEQVHIKTSLLDASEYENLRFLQKQRHLCAHPVLNSARELHSPNKETVRALLRNTLQGLLVKPPFYTQRIIDELLADLAESGNALANREKVIKYVESKYLSRITTDVAISIFRSLWKFVFKLTDDDCEKNRNVNFNTMEAISNMDISIICNEIAGDKDFYSNIASSGNPISFLVYYLSKYPKVYPLLNDDAKLKIDNCILYDEVGRSVGWFTKRSLNAHADDIEKWIRSEDYPSFVPNQIDAIFEISDSEEWQKRFCQILAIYYSISKSFDDADLRFQLVIPKYINLFDSESLEYLIYQIEKNPQCYLRGRAIGDYVVIKERLEELSMPLDYENAPNFTRKISRP